MCIAILKKDGVNVPQSQLEESFMSNPDGSGYLFANKGKLSVKKGFFTFDDFIDNYSRDMERFNNPVSIIHFRITTHGLTNKLNCHPFLVNDSLGFAHNGIINFVSDHKKKSDTMMFKREILQQLPDNFIYNDTIIKLIEESIGNSKLVFLNSQGDYKIANETAGHWNDEKTIWYSNKSYCETPTQTWVNAWGGHNNYYDYEVLNITNKKKKKNTHDDCRTCQGNLFTQDEKKLGHCHTCQAEFQTTRRI